MNWISRKVVIKNVLVYTKNIYINIYIIYICICICEIIWRLISWFHLNLINISLCKQLTYVITLPYFHCSSVQCFSPCPIVNIKVNSHLLFLFGCHCVPWQPERLPHLLAYHTELMLPQVGEPGHMKQTETLGGNENPKEEQQRWENRFLWGWKHSWCFFKFDRMW